MAGCSASSRDSCTTVTTDGVGDGVGDPGGDGAEAAVGRTAKVPVTRMRLDERLVADDLVESRSTGQRLIMAGAVKVDGQRSDKPGTKVRSNQTVTVDRPPKFVSRGGDKLDNGINDLAGELAAAHLDVAGAIAIDIGASTGGFTDCLLQRRAAHVIAVDVGYGQLHPRIRDDARVQVLERTNARVLTPELLDRDAAGSPLKPTLIVCDASFIPLRTVLPAPLRCMAPSFWGLILCKPQFEAGRARMSKHGRKGVLRDAAVRDTIVRETLDDLRALGLLIEGLVEARPRGPKGNIEYVVLVRSGGVATIDDAAHGPAGVPIEIDGAAGS